MIKANTNLSILFFILLITSPAYSQIPISIGESYTLNSSILDQERTIQVYLPEGHDTTKQKYPVLYILDGQWFFSNGVAIQQSLRVPDRLPELIVVGIKNANPLRYTLFWDDRDKFLSFLMEEVAPFVQEKFRASDERIIYGWETGAYFATYALFHDRQFFDAAIVTNGAYADEELLETYEALPLPKNKYLFLANSKRDIYTIRGSEALNKLLKDKTPKNLIWKYQLFDNEIHESLPYLSMYHGLNYYYHDFQSLTFSSIQEFHDLGGMAYLKSYFKKRGERYGFPTEIDNGTKNGLIWLAWNRDDFDSFTFFMTEFADVLSTKRYDSAYWQNRFAQFYLKHGDFDNAIHYFQVGIRKYPNDARQALMHFGLGKTFHNKEQVKLALENYEKAVAIAEKNGDTELKNYKAAMSELREQLNQK